MTRLHVHEKGSVIDAFQEARTELVADFKAYANDVTRQLLVQPATRFALRQNQRKHGASIEALSVEVSPNPTKIHSRSRSRSAFQKSILFIFASCQIWILRRGESGEERFGLSNE